MSKED